MSRDLICSWLGLEPGHWPPDHYRLLGLEPGETDARLIEERIHQRLDAVRRYQMTHPEPATEAMNRLAQAFVCLTEPAAKLQYDAVLLGRPLPTPPPLPVAAPAPQPLVQLLEPVVRGVTVSDPTPLPLPALEALPKAPPPPPPAAERVDPIREAAESFTARRGLGTRRALYRRIVLTRQLLAAWLAIGKFFSTSRRRSLRGTEGEELIDLLGEILGLARDFPPLLGEAGQPGFLLWTLAREDVVPYYRSLEASQLGALRRDWEAGLELLKAHRTCLRREARDLRNMTRGQRFRRTICAWMGDRPWLVTALLALLTANVILWHSYLHDRALHKCSTPPPPAHTAH